MNITILYDAVEDADKAEAEAEGQKISLVSFLGMSACIICFFGRLKDASTLFILSSSSPYLLSTVRISNNH